MHSQGTTLRATGDWNDVHAAAIVGALESESSLVRIRAGGPEHAFVEYDITTLLDQPGMLRITRLTEGQSVRHAEHEGVELELFAHVGRFGDKHREERIVEEVAARLGKLEGVEWAER